MAEAVQEDASSLLLSLTASLLKGDDKGWGVHLFKNQMQISACMCAHCGSVCCDAVELGCEHNDDDNLLYCNKCLKFIITDNNGKCPVDSHADPSTIPNRAIRRQIAKCTVGCPYSRAFQALKSQQQEEEAQDGAHFVDTIGGDEKEGVPSAHANHGNDGNDDNDCAWTGTLQELTTQHMVACAQKNKSSFVLEFKIRGLQRRNQVLTEENEQMRLKAEEARLAEAAKLESLNIRISRLQEKNTSAEQDSRTVQEQLNQDIL